MLSLAIMLISDSIYTGFQSEIKDKITGFAASVLISKTNSDFTFENEPVPYDAAFVKNLAASLLLPFELGTEDVQARVTREKLSL